MQSDPGCSASTSSREVCAFMQTIRSTSFLRAIQPSLFARIVNHVGRPAMFDGNMFLPDTGTPIWKIERIRTLLDDCDPEPLTVATWMVRSLVVGSPPRAGGSSTAEVEASVTSISLEEAGILCGPVGKQSFLARAAFYTPPHRASVLGPRSSVYSSFP